MLVMLWVCVIVNIQFLVVCVQLLVLVLLKVDISNGNINGCCVEYVIDLVIDGVVYQQVMVSVFDGKIINKYVCMYCIELLLVCNGWMIWVWCMMLNVNSGMIVDMMCVELFVEVIDVKLCYLNLVLIGLCIDVCQFSNILMCLYWLCG